jgi:hypothetical protein
MKNKLIRGFASAFTRRHPYSNNSCVRNRERERYGKGNYIEKIV